MTKKNLQSDILRGPESSTPDTPGKPRLFLHLAAAFLFAFPPLSMSITVLADTPGPLDTEAFHFQGGDQTQETLTVGVLDLDANGVEETEARAISERLRIWLGRTGVFEVIERNQMESIMNEIGFQVSGACDTDECVVQIGQVLGASKMVAGSVSLVGSLYSLQIRLIDIASSRIDDQVFKDVVGGIEEVLMNASREVADELAARVTGQAVQQQPVTPPSINPGQPARVTTAMVMIESTPRGGTTMVDGRDMGPTPANLQLNEGTHEISVELAGYRAGTQTIDVIGGQDQTVTLSLTEIPKGYLSVTTDPVQCEVYVDGELMGQRSPIRRLEIFEGSHTIEVRKDGFDPATREVVITPRENSGVTINLRATGSAQITFRNQLTGAVATIVGRESYQAELNRAEESLSMMPGDYILTVKAKGYSKYTSRINLADGDNQVIPITLRPKSRIAAGILSVIPGMGQFYSGKGFMGFLMLAGVGGTLGATLAEQSNYDDILAEYEDLQDQYSRATTTDQIQNLRSLIEDRHGALTASRDKMNQTALIMTVVWAVNILDAIALMPRLRPIAVSGVQSDLSLGTREGRLSLTLSLSFK